MKRPTQIAHAQKIYNCVDELLMEDVEYQVEQDRVQREMENSSGLKKIGSRIGTRAAIRSKGKPYMVPEKRLGFTTKKNTEYSSKEQKLKALISPSPTNKINFLNQKGDQRLSDPNLGIPPNMKLKRTVSEDPNRLLQTQESFLNTAEQQSDNSFIGGRDVSPGLAMSQLKDIREMMIEKDEMMLGTKKNVELGKNQLKNSQRNQKKGTQVAKKPRNGHRSGQLFHLTHDQLQFLSLLYPNQTPQELMIKLLTYYEQQLQYKNSFQDIAYREKKKKNYFFKSKANLYDRERDKIGEDSQDESDTKEQWLPVSGNIVEEDGEEMLNEYTRLKEECLAALGSQMVETQVKSSTVQTANVNYYTRQYAMPHIMQLVEQKNLQSEQKLQKQNLSKAKHHQRHQSAPAANTGPALIFTQSSFNQDMIHKVYIPANSRGQCFDMDYEPESTLFNYVPENEYRRILRDVNHLIQKVLLHHRHNSFIKKRSNSILGGGWNLVLVLFLFSLLVMLYLECFYWFQTTSSYLQIVVFFSLSFVLILILGNAFNNYKKSVKRSSLIKDVCEEITNYLEFANCSSKNIKWVLGKDFFWLEIWIYLKKARVSNVEKGK